MYDLTEAQQRAMRKRHSAKRRIKLLDAESTRYERLRGEVIKDGVTLVKDLQTRRHACGVSASNQLGAGDHRRHPDDAPAPSTCARPARARHPRSARRAQPALRRPASAVTTPTGATRGGGVTYNQGRTMAKKKTQKGEPHSTALISTLAATLDDWEARRISPTTGSGR